MMDDVGLDDLSHVNMSIKNLNKHLKTKGVTKVVQKEVKARRTI
jgi:hypothetical protein